MKTVSYLPQNIVSFIELATDIYQHSPDVDFDVLADEFAKLSTLAANAVQRILLSAMSEMSAHPHEAASGWDTNQVLLEVNKYFSLGISILHISPPHLLNAVSDAAYINVGRAHFEYAMHSLPDNFHREVFDPDIRPHPGEEHVLLPGNVLRVHAGVDLIDWRIATPVLLLRFISAPTEILQWTFRKAPIRPWFVASVDPGATQLSALCAYFAANHHPGAAQPMMDLLHHRNHQVRWEATRSMWKIDRDIGLQALRAALDDVHPHVRNAATRTMAKLNQ